MIIMTAIVVVVSYVKLKLLRGGSSATFALTIKNYAKPKKDRRKYRDFIRISSRSKNVIFLCINTFIFCAYATYHCHVTIATNSLHMVLKKMMSLDLAHYLHDLSIFAREEKGISIAYVVCIIYAILYMLY